MHEGFHISPIRSGSGGSANGVGFTIAWQAGALTLGKRLTSREYANGAFPDTVLAAVQSRILEYQGSDSACDEYAEVLKCLDAAMVHFEEREKRVEREEWVRENETLDPSWHRKHPWSITPVPQFG